MKSLLIASVVSFAAAFAAAGLFYADKAGPPADSALDTPSFDRNLPMEQRIVALEQAVSVERQARQLLEDEIFYLTNELALQDRDEYSPAEIAIANDDTSAPARSDRREDYRRRNSSAGRIERLIEAGFLPGRAAQIVQREAQLQMESLQARYEAERSGNPVEWWRGRDSSSSSLRNELGDTDYARYLEANNRATSVSISSVIESSPAAAAGLLPGDEIVRYDGQRVFSMTELTQQTMNGTSGENVAVDIMRDGIQMQVVMPRGPFGISGGRRRQ